MDNKTLVGMAIAARERSYSPYSHFAVGTALLDSDGRVWQGCNIENAAYSPSHCAERTAFIKAVSEGVRSFVAIAIVGGPVGEPPHEWCAPCGVCRQIMREFCDVATFRVVMGRVDGGTGELLAKEYVLDELLPESFGPETLG